MIADSIGFPGAWPLVPNVDGLWLLVIIPPMIVVLPVIIRGNQSSSAVMQLQRWISQYIGNSILSKLRTNSANNYPLCLQSLEQ